MKIIIFAGATIEDWSPKSIASGIGGSEEAVINIAKELVSLGHSVTVYNQCGEDAGIYDGVEYKKFISYRGEACDVLIGWRSADCFKMSKKAKLKIKWLHDTTPEQRVMQSRDEGADKVMVLSRYHRRLYPSMPNSDFYITRNGVDLSLFKGKVKRVPGRLFYGSSYDRGLRELLTEWPKIKLANPEASLHIAYGWGTWEAQANAEAFKAVKEDMEKLMNQDGITHLGRINHKQVAKEFMEADVWAYPCWFPEISPVHGDTEVETLNGKHKIKDLVGKKDFHVYSCDQNGDLSISKVNGVFKTRDNTKMLKVTFKPWTGVNAKKTKTLILTPDHEVLMRDGSYIMAGSLSIGDRVKVFHRQKNDWGKGYDSIGVTDREKVPEHRFVAEKFHGNTKGLEIDHLDNNTYNNNPDNLEIKTTSEHWKDTWKRKTLEERKLWAEDRANTLKKYQAQFSKEELSEISRSAANIRWNKVKLSNHAIVNIEEVENADAYCMEVEPDHNFVANGIFVHNCITAMKAQVGGALPVVIPTAALSETVKFGIKTDRGYYQNVYGDIIRPEETLDQFTASVNYFLGLEEDEKEELRKEMIEWSKENFGWDCLAKDWEAYFINELKHKDEMQSKE